MDNPPLRECIYCRAKPGDIVFLTVEGKERELTVQDFGREHILPQGLGGDITLPKASCPNCGSITGEIERIVIRRMFWGMRSTSGHKSGVKLPDSNFFGIIPVYEPADLLLGQSVTEPKFRAMPLQAEPRVVHKLKRHAKSIHGSTYTLDLPTLARFLAKIAHGSCVRHWGLNGFFPFLVPLILGQDAEWWHLVGCTAGEALESDDPKRIHTIETRRIHIEALRPFDPDAEFAYTRIRLFSHVKGFPTYHVVSGLMPGYNKLLLDELFFRGLIFGKLALPLKERG